MEITIDCGGLSEGEHRGTFQGVGLPFCLENLQMPQVHVTGTLGVICMLQARVPAKSSCQDSPEDPVVKTPRFQAWVQSLGRELRSCMPWAEPKKKKAAPLIPKQERQACRHHTDSGLKPDSGTSGISLLVILHKMDMPRSISPVPCQD